MKETVRISFSENQPDAVSTDLINSLESLGASVDLRQVSPAKFVNIIEWALPAGVALWVTKSFFDAMLGKLGEAAGEILLAAIRKQFLKSKESDERYYSRSDFDQAREILSSDSTKSWSSALSNKGKRIAPLEINVEGYQFESWEIQFRFVFPAALSEESVEEAIRLLNHNRNNILQNAVKIESIGMLPPQISKNEKVDLIYNHETLKWQTAREVIKEKVGKQKKVD